MDDVTKGHAARVRAVDPLLADQDELPVGDGQLIEAPDAAGVTRVERLDPGAMQSLWGPLVVSHLKARVAGADPEVALGGLLDRWTGLADEAMDVWWPSRDTAPVRALAVRGFAPTTVLAVGRPRPVDAPAVTIRRADDLDVLAPMYEALVAYDAQFGWVTTRARTTELLRAHLADAVLPREWCWLAEVAGRPAGFAVVSPPDAAGWIASVVDDAPVAYFGAMYVDPSARGRGVGAALVRVAHERAAAEGVSAMLLHHALPNPHSTPFWAGQGYRPLLTQWARHPQGRPRAR
ncbi:Acetyltransferase (GNAT) family protein [Nonomuraea maritima]|uniref:Acetyltransferase (GNAT) family protein n=1 Tax=Nonomuraea maritima TaxID=683260 RepID=A0A1G9AED8_9ACTN|nr:GNAT family N-acetyltransferase [Nonomuraea maritima]SDK25184.1 Acetyltransferase (GNAT) family protein [Nonomuraea maritima]